jgi:3-oxoadipate enol-lactonase
MVRDTPPEGYAGCCEAIRDMDMRARLGAIRAPTLLITGADDLVTRPEHARLICGSISESRLVVIPQAAHLANIEQPVAVIQAVLYHLGPVAERRVG